MDGLLKNLQEQEYHLKQQHLRFYVHDLANMDNLNDREPPVPPRRKYVSIFRIDGEPILPPLMTMEKRKQMQKMKEKALKIEQRIREHKQRVNNENNINTEDIISITSRSSACNTNENVSQRSHDYYEVNLKETEESMMLLQNLIRRQEDKDDFLEADRNGSIIETNNREKIQKLKKSEILIFDNTTNEVIQITPEEDETKTILGHSQQLSEFDHQTNLNYLQPKKPSHLLLAGVEVKGMKTTPAICLNPPTPLVANRNICDELNSTPRSHESFIISAKTNEDSNFRDDVSSDESFNSMITHTDRKQFSKNLISKTKHTTNSAGKDAAKSPAGRSHKKMINVSNKIQQYEAFSSETNTPETSPEKMYHAKKSCLETSSSSIMNRSATSPSIKLANSQRSSSRSQSLAQDSDNSPENTLVRSSSFTLEGPSKALIDHMKQQKTINQAKAAVKTPPTTATRNVLRKSISSPLRCHRDTVESKAKKVQKVELKSSKQKVQQKTSQSKLAQAAAASLSPYNNNSITQQSKHLYRAKKSPYESSQNSLHSSTSQKSTTSSTYRKSPSTTSSNILPAKSGKTRVLSSPMQQTPMMTLTTQHAAKSPGGKEKFSQMDKTQQEKFLKLLAQQEEEHRRLQQSFEMQQKMLMEQLNKEMGAIQIKSSTTTSSPSAQKKGEQQQLPTHLQNQLNLSGFSSDNTINKPNSSQQPSPTISNNSSQLTLTTNTQCQAHQTSFSTHYNQAPSSVSNLSSMDHSNANTSWDISTTLSNQTSPDTSSAITTPTNTISNSNNMSGNKSSSRRRLFAADISDLDVGTTKPSSYRSTASSAAYPSLSRSMELAQQPQQQHTQVHHNKSSIGLSSHDGSSRRLNEQEAQVQYAAATKINACARGFLVRRLFQTEQIQRIVQTIRDTLIFVLNLHMETMENPDESRTPANIKLKARLLQQLTSACRTLHLVFFQTSIKERMEIIARDRKRIKTKLLSMNRKSINPTPKERQELLDNNTSKLEMD